MRDASWRCARTRCVNRSFIGSVYNLSSHVCQIEEVNRILSGNMYGDSLGHVERHDKKLLLRNSIAVHLYVGAFKMRAHQNSFQLVDVGITMRQGTIFLAVNKYTNFLQNSVSSFRKVMYVLHLRYITLHKLSMLRVFVRLVPYRVYSYWQNDLRLAKFLAQSSIGTFVALCAGNGLLTTKTLVPCK